MKLKDFSLLGVKKQQFLFMKKLTYRKRFFTVVPNTIDFVKKHIHTLHHGFVTHFLKANNSEID